MTDWVAKQHIYAGDPGRGVIAHAKGDRVSAERVKANGWEDQVVAAGSREGRQVLADVTGEPVVEESAGAVKPSSEKKG
jgi:hypothetical protein